MGRKTAILLTLLILIASFSAALASKKSARIEGLYPQDLARLHAAPQFAAAEQCTVSNLGDMAWLINHWLVGAELYKSYQDPGLACSGPYPFSVEEVHLILYVNTLPCTLYVSVDVETADMTDPECPFPGDLLSLSSEYMFILDQPDYNLYQITVPLDSTAVVDEPFFAGFYIANVIDTTRGVELVTDDFPVACRDYNIWDTTIGYVDLTNTGFEAFPSFPGRVFLFASGTTGGSGGIQPEPQISLLKPSDNEVITGALEIWGVETAGNEIMDSVKFEYGDGVNYNTIAVDDDGGAAFRNGVDPSGSGTGWYTVFDYFALSEGNYYIKATGFDTLGRSSTDSCLVNIDPTPPDPTLTNPIGQDTICLPITLNATSVDEDLQVMQFMKKDAVSNYAISPVTLNQYDYGDSDGDPLDGNSAADGEDGDYYCGPVAAATALKYWFDKGYLNVLKEGAYFIPVDTAVERLAELMRLRQENGTADDMLYYALTAYNNVHGSELLFDCFRDPDYLKVRSLFQEEENFVILGTGGSPGWYFSLMALNGLMNLQGQYNIGIIDPATGTPMNTVLRDNFGQLEINYGGVWHPLETVITVVGGTHTVTWNLIANDASAAGGWSYDWASSSLLDGDLAFVRATAVDNTGRMASDQAMILYDCGGAMMVADYDGDSDVDTQDLIYLINYIYKDGSAPSGGAQRADANCDDIIDISDVIYAINYFYAGGPAPCH